MKKNVIWLAYVATVLLGGIFFMSWQCHSQFPPKDVEQCIPTDKKLLTTNIEEYSTDVEVYSTDSVVWRTSDYSTSAHLYKYQRDTTHYILRSEFDNALMKDYIQSENIQNCIKMMKDECLNSLSKEQFSMLETLSEGRASILIQCLLDRHGTIKGLSFLYYI